MRSRYRVISELGDGAFGTVCLAEDESTGHRVALRFLPRRLSETAVQAVSRMARSIVAASSTHPVLTRVLEFGEDESGQRFAVMERVEGRRLSEITSKGRPLDVATAMRMALDLGGGLETLHNMGFVHGAVYPHNIVVLDDGRIKLLDIELAGLRDAPEIEGVIVSVPPAEYLAPEQVLKAPASEKTDTYAFGVILHELLCGAPPFQDTSREAVLAKHLRSIPAPIHSRRRDVPAPVERAVALALGKRPESRPLLGDLLNLLWAAAHGPAPGRGKPAAIAAAAALAALAAGAVTWGVLALRPWEPASLTPTARPAPQVPQSAPPASAIPVPEARPRPQITPTPPSPPTRPVERAPVVAPRSPAAVEPRPAPAAQPPAVQPPAARAPAPATSPDPPRVERREPARAPTAAPTASPSRPAPASDPDDPGAVIDWLLNPSSRP